MPDLIVGLLTGAAVGLVVIGAERRISDRAHRALVEDAQSKAVDRARGLLQHKVRFKSTPDDVLHLDMTQFDRLRDVIRAVPSGEPRTPFPGYFWAAEASTIANDIEVLADALEGRIGDYETENPRDMDTTKWMRRTISELAATKRSARTRSWEWQWNRDVHLTYARRVAYDADLTSVVDQYLSKIDLLLAHREAFLEADGMWRMGTRLLHIESPYGRPTLFQALIHPSRKRRILSEARREANEAAGAIIRSALAD